MAEGPDDIPFWSEMRWFVPMAAVLLLMPPILMLFAGGRSLLGMPLLPLYIFLVWALAILACAMTSRRTSRRPPRPDEMGP